MHSCMRTKLSSQPGCGPIPVSMKTSSSSAVFALTSNTPRKSLSSSAIVRYVVSVRRDFEQTRSQRTSSGCFAGTGARIESGGLVVTAVASERSFLVVTEVLSCSERCLEEVDDGTFALSISSIASIASRSTSMSSS